MEVDNKQDETGEAAPRFQPSHVVMLSELSLREKVSLDVMGSRLLYG
jgi:hypothetical protein